MPTRREKLRALLEKKELTGKQLGTALLHSLINDKKNGNKADYNAYFTDEEIQKMIQRLPNQKELLIYAMYTNLYEALLTNFNAHVDEYVFSYGKAKLFLLLTELQRAERNYLALEHVPYVVAEKEYTEIKKYTESKRRKITTDFEDVCLSVISDFFKNPNNAPLNLKNAIDENKNKPVKSSLLINNYILKNDLGYYELYDGSTSNDLFEEKFFRKVKDAYTEKNYNTIDAFTKMQFEKNIRSIKCIFWYLIEQRFRRASILLFNGETELNKFYQKRTKKELSNKERKELFKTLGEISMFYVFSVETHKKITRDFLRIELRANSKQDDILWETLGGSLKEVVKWHYFTPKEIGLNLTLNSVLKEDINLYDDPKYPSYILQTLKNEFPKLHENLVNYVKTTIPKFKEITQEQYKKPLITWGELSDLNIANYKELCKNYETHDLLEFFNTKEDTFESFLKQRRIITTGINVSKPAKDNIKEEEFLIGEELAEIKYLNIENLTEEYFNEIKNIKDNYILDFMQKRYAYNAIVDILAERFKFKSLKTFKLPEYELEEVITTLNGMVYDLYAHVYGREKEKKHKREIIKNIFEILYFEPLRPSDTVKKEISKEIDEILANKIDSFKLKDFDYFIEKINSERGLRNGNNTN